MAVIRGPRPDSNYFITPRAYARDWRLSLKEKGALMYMMSHSENYDLTTEQMIAECADGRDSVQNALRGLEAKGYLVRVQRRAAKAEETDTRSGTFQGYDYQITDPPPLPIRARKPRRAKSGATVAGKAVDGADPAEGGPTAAGKAVDGKPDDGKPATKKYPKVVEDQGLVDQLKISLSDQDAQAVSSVAVDPPEREIAQDLKSESQAVDTLVAEARALHPTWSLRLIRKAIRDELEDRRTLDKVEAAWRMCIADPKTTTPNRFKHPGPWWDAAYRQAGPKPPSPRAAAVAECRRCDPSGWLLDVLPAQRCDHSVVVVA